MGPPEPSTAYISEVSLALALVARCSLRSKREISAAASQGSTQTLSSGRLIPKQAR
jgi:hypothetical protein